MIRLLALLFPYVLLNLCSAQAYDVLCKDGNTSFEAYFHGGVEVDVGPPVSGKLATRVCRAMISWDDHELVVANPAAQIDLDMFGVDVGANEPVAAFQIKKSAADCCMSYHIYSLQAPPRLLRRLHGGGYFRGVDTNLAGHVEIWTDDIAAIDGLEGVRASELEYPPTSVLRFEDGKLVDVSSEFQSYFDGVSATIRAKIDPEQLRKFKLTNGRLEDRARSQAKQPAADDALRKVKRQVLELVWAYLYSNRDKEGWKILAEMWPAGDVARIRSALLQARARGIRSQLDGVSEALPPLDEATAGQVKIYDSTSKPARPIIVRYYPSAGGQPLRGKFRVDLVVDSAGKVWSVKVSGKNKAAYDSVKRSTANWKFIPGFVHDSPVASRVRMTISLEQ